VRRCLLSVVLLIAVAGCVPGPTPTPIPTRAAAIEGVLERWTAWVRSAMTDPSPPPSSQRLHCAEDPGSALWFVDTPTPDEPTARWTCTVPAGRALVVAPLFVGVQLGDLDCTTIFALFTGEADLDGRPVALRRAGPLNTRGPATGPTPRLGDCALWGITPELDRGPHTLTQRLAGQGLDPVTVEVDITAT
jgi:hypothetical protein